MIEFVKLDRPRGALWSCRCECGNMTSVHTNDLRGGNSRSCGCLVRDTSAKTNLKHGAAVGGGATGAYRSYRAMTHRCYQESNVGYKDYGGRGITVCDRWMGADGFQNFLSDMGERGEGMSLERHDVGGNYEPLNCLWIPMAHQAKNTRNTVWVIVDGQRMCQADAERHLGLHRGAICDRKRNGRGLPDGVVFA